MNHSLEYFLGFAVGVLAGLALIAVLIFIIRKLGGKTTLFCKKDSFDERQLLARGKAYKVAFFTLMFYMAGISMLNDIAEIKFFMSFGGIWLGICISLMLFAITCIIKDAYMSLYENARGVILLFGIIGFLNLMIGLRNAKEKNFLIEDGRLSTNSVNFVVGILFIVILVAFSIKLLYDKKHEADEE